MKQAEEKVRRAIRRKAEESLTIYDMHTNRSIGQVVDMSAQGMKLESEKPVEVSHIYYCRLPLAKKKYGRKEIFFDAECRWCRKNNENGRYNSGYKLRFPSPKDYETVQHILRRWMTEQLQRYNAFEDNNKSKKKNLLGRLLRGS